MELVFKGTELLFNLLPRDIAHKKNVNVAQGVLLVPGKETEEVCLRQARKSSEGLPGDF